MVGAGKAPGVPHATHPRRRWGREGVARCGERRTVPEGDGVGKKGRIDGKEHELKNY